MTEPTPPSRNHDGEEPEPPYPSLGYAWFVVAVLMIVYVFSFIDRQVLSLLVEPMKKDLGISEFQMSLLMGLTFAMFYTVIGIPIGRLVDRLSRTKIIAAGLVVWSIMTAFCGVARRYYQFFLLRMGVGVGEGTLSPAAYSLITDYFPKEKLGTAMSVYSMGIYIGQGLAVIVPAYAMQYIENEAGYQLPFFGHIYWWQMVFLIVGLPGLPLALLLLAVREPVRRGIKSIKTAAGTTAAPQVPIGVVVKYLKANAVTFVCHNLGFGLLALAAYGASAWIPAHFARNLHIPGKEMGKIFGWITIFGGSGGIVFAGWLADKLARRGRRNSKMYLGLIASVVWFPFGIAFPLATNPTLAYILLFFTIFTASMPFGVAPAAIAEMIPANMRGQMSAVYLFVINLIGMGLGPSAVAILTQYYFKDPTKVGVSLVVVGTVAHVLSTILLGAGLKPFERSMDYLRNWTQEQAKLG